MEKLFKLCAAFHKLSLVKKAMSTHQAFSILGLPLGAPVSSIKKNYRGLVHKHHPDKIGNSPEAHEIISKINKAYSVALENAGGAALNEDDEVDRIMNEYRPEDFVSQEEIMGYGDWMEENPGEYERRHGLERARVTKDIKGARYRKTRMGVAENLLRDIDWSEMFNAFHKIRTEAEKIQNKTVPTLYTIVVSSIEPKLRSLRHRLKQLAHLKGRSLSEIRYEEYGGFGADLAGAYHILRDDGIGNELATALSHTQSLSQTYKDDAARLIETINHAKTVYEKVKTQYSTFWNIYSEIYSGDYLGALNG